MSIVQLFSNKVKPPIIKIPGLFLWNILYKSSLHIGSSLCKCIIVPYPAIITLPQQSCHNPNTQATNQVLSLWKRVLVQKLLNMARKSQNVNDPEILLPHSQQSATYPILSQIYFKVHLVITLSYMHWSSKLSPLGFHTKIWRAHLFSPYVSYTIYLLHGAVSFLRN